MTHEKIAPEFRGIASDAEKGLVLTPLLRTFLFEAQFPADFWVHFKKEQRRAPDGWFHPSEHPLWTERRLYYYLTAPHLLIPEPMEYMGTLSVTIGKALHGFIEMCLQVQGVLMTPDRLRAAGYEVDPETGEPMVKDEETGARGRPDGVTEIHVPQYTHWPRQIFEFKSSNDMKLSRIDDLDLEAYKEKWPGYYAQNQEQMRLSGLSVTLVLFMALGYPWKFKEFHVPADPRFQAQIREKYLRARKAAAAGSPPIPCCSPGSSTARTCESRGVCPIGSM